ncbi:hypothetical protein AGABI2DRAFT_182630 [Agaricus bisporus var. bisporus H97]|uniref:hypothetical protein n=1 Tax=Agaricus bisporus var. bisporus (strain H97 / ATCC MYA-4626 / FGSC 10389) TaxID=936046 RepID=UPI00029F72BA|nr:hypothetical protein AGABI2DRAFT_182630 [Agaricus bisporus var. bisporus H97]EKV51679.1 hypothetical protein AGABI2DRAFT_182630 [Agaricus bisporus var. bisporus H97]
MQSTPSPSAGRGDAVLQPAYFTSVLYVQPLRDDISSLTEDFRTQFAQRDATTSPFSVFRQLWVLKGWKWLHFKVFDDRARQTFLLVTLRLFLERIGNDDPLSRVVGVFGAYTFYYTQPCVAGPPLGRINHIPLPIDCFAQLTRLSDGLISEELEPLREPLLFVTRTMIQDQIFYLLPSSESGAENPRALPREVLVADPAAMEIEPRKRGRPSKREKAKRAQAALAELDRRLDSPSAETTIPEDSLWSYSRDKSELMAVLEGSGDMEGVRQANAIILERMREAQAASVEVGGEYVGVGRVERAVGDGNVVGVFGLLEGAGREG